MSYCEEVLSVCVLLMFIDIIIVDLYAFLFLYNLIWVTVLFLFFTPKYFMGSFFCVTLMEDWSSQNNLNKNKTKIKHK